MAKTSETVGRVGRKKDRQTDQDIQTPQRSKRKEMVKLMSQMEVIRDEWESSWEELSRFIKPAAAEFETSDHNQSGERRDRSSILDNTASVSVRTFESGMMAALTSPAQPWFRLSVPDPDLAQEWSVKDWTDIVTNRLRVVMRMTNLYNRFPVWYGDFATFGTAAMLVEPHVEKIAVTHVMPIGSYMVANGPDGRVNTFGREFVLSVRQIVEQFATDEWTGEIDWSMLSPRVKAAWARGDFEHEVPVCHVIAPNRDWDPRRLEAKYKKFASCYWEKHYGEGEKLLRESGYDHFPVICARWRVTGTDYYGSECPGMMALGDIKELQQMRKVALQALEKEANPPLVGPSTMRDITISTIPGHFTPEDLAEGRKGLRPIYEVRPQLSPLEIVMAGTRERIRNAFYENIISALIRLQRGDMTAREVEEIHSEKFMLFGPVLEQVNFDALDPLIDLYFVYSLERGLIPEPPEELQGVALNVEYISIMAVAQKLSGVEGIDRLIRFISNLAAGSQDMTVWDKIDSDAAAELYADFTSVPVKMVRPSEKVDQMRQQRARAAAQAQMMAALSQGASAAKDLAAAKTDEDNALTNIVDQASQNPMVPV